MNLVNEKVIHNTFGQGNVLNYDDSYIKINFESGTKRFIFPDAFGTYITLVNETAASVIRKKLRKQEEKRKKEALRLKKERALQEKRQQVLEQNKRMRNRKVHPEQQAVFWCDAHEEDRIFTEWRVFIGKIKSGQKKGEPRRLARINQNSACIITKREPDMPEKDRRILGVFMTEKAFNGRLCEDGYIPAHPKYKLRLSEQESEKMLFWNYYVNNRSPNNMTWNSGRQRYLNNIWVAQILYDIVSLKQKPEDKEDVELFLNHFCKINCINKDELPKANGALMRV